MWQAAAAVTAALHIAASWWMAARHIVTHIGTSTSGPDLLPQQ
jgi:hypothetical protein